MVVKPAVEKLPLVTRKNLRDNWESKKADYEKQLSDQLGGTWTITFEPALIYANSQRKDMLDRLGDGVTWYIEPLISNARQWVEEYGPEGVAELDALSSKHTVHFRPQDDESKFTYGGIIFKEGVLHLVFAEDNFVTNVDNVSSPDAITEAIIEASKRGEEGAQPGKLNVKSRQDIRKNWDVNKEEIRKRIADQVKIDDIVLAPQFEEIAAALVADFKPKDKNEEYRFGRDLRENIAQIGSMTKLYYEAFANQLKNDKFADDDMLQEAFQEGVTAKKVGLRVVDKLQKSSYCEVVIEDGTLWMQTTPKEWRVNIDAVGNTLMDLF